MSAAGLKPSGPNNLARRRPLDAEASSAKPLAAETHRENDFGIDAEAQGDAFSESLFEKHTQEVPGAPHEVDEKLKQIWDELEKLSSPSLEEINALLDKLFSLPPEATFWSEVFHTIARHQPGELPEMFHRIAGNVPHTKETGMAYFLKSGLAGCWKVVGDRTRRAEQPRPDRLQRAQSTPVAPGP
jgi:hypothetical protein